MKDLTGGVTTMENKKGYLDLASKAYEDKSNKNISIWDILKESAR